MFDTMKIAKKIREARMAKNMTQMNLADAMGVSYQAVSNWERGNSMPDISKLEDLCNALDITVNELLGMETKAATAVEKVIQEEPLTVEELAEVAPILPPETIQKQAGGKKKKWNIAALSEIAPFLSSSMLEELVEDMEVESLTLLTCLAPFLDEDVLDKLVRRAPQDDFDGIGAMAPFLSQKTLDYLVERCEGRPEDWAFMQTLACFLSDEALEKLVEKYGDDLNGSMITCLAPFLNETILDGMVNRQIEKGNVRGLASLYPFLSEHTMRKVVNALMESGDAEDMKQAEMFL